MITGTRYYKILKKESTIFLGKSLGKLSSVSSQVMGYCLDFAQKLIPMTSYK